MPRGGLLRGIGALALVLLPFFTTTRLTAQAATLRPTVGEITAHLAIDPPDSTTLSDRPSPGAARPAGRKLSGLTATYGPYTRHTGKGHYNARSNFTGLEWETASRWSYGASYFSNSFWQPCWFAHASRRFTFSERDDGFFCKIAMGVIYGYQPPHADSVPFNVRGFCPAIIPSIGYKFKGTAVHLVVYGKNAGQMPLFSHDLR